ncbi:signal peptidase I (plasmid) [Gemmatirosa kalamazoonensis]|uniref:Signal peptidase I n=1 Tax=Gemmatirosa kalamazoonensis TaxID=861299 RepID=W0RNZ8_9BACT|nr:signal peptidase I [Gemmatirosa kalamazoonensis]AHG92719.1 signal peptidase I [Gemmatirosa kalamazoonensis]
MSRFRHTVRELARNVLPVVAVTLGTRVALAEPYHIPSGSMEPTLLVGDWLFVNKLRYGPHVPLTHVSLPGYAEPRRGDIAVFVSPPQDPSIRMAPDEITPVLVKRIVGVGGDTLAMRAGRLYVNGVAESRGATPASDFTREPLPIFAWQHQLETSSASTRPTLHDWGPLVVPRDMYFMMGDNRDDSVDSRFYGPVPRANLRGTPTVVYYSYDTEAGLDWFRAVTEIRWRRLGTWIR